MTTIADTRASIKDQNQQWVAQNEATTKLYRAVVDCYELSGLEQATGSWRNPYFSTELGIGFSGACFEAMSVITLFQRSVGQLVDEGGMRSRPTPKGLTDMLVKITDRWFKQDNYSDGMKVEFLLFGFSPIDGSPWAVQIERTSASGVRVIYSSLPIQCTETYLIGDVTPPSKMRWRKYATAFTSTPATSNPEGTSTRSMRAILRTRETSQSKQKGS